jgi:hypothetical protein
MNVKFPNNTSKWQIEFNSAFKGLNINSERCSVSRARNVAQIEKARKSYKSLVENHERGRTFGRFRYKRDKNRNEL